MSGRSVWAFKMASRRRAVVITHTDRTRIFYLACEMKQLEGSVSKVHEYQLVLYQKLIQLIDNSSTSVNLYWGLQRCTCDSNTAR